MNPLIEPTQLISFSKTDLTDLSNSNQRSRIKQELRQKINAALQVAQCLPPQECLQEIKSRLLAIQADCSLIQKTFIVIEERITCDQYGLGGYRNHMATLFRGPSEDASVAICVTDRGSLLHRNGSPWQVYRNAGDVMDHIPSCMDS
ncbi:hypothetical protein OsccyDRAFT_4289 [Leptolyngbyaceae cyanobacterium JSC-12]|nr:hypothetical protein OsccyDRAFT_4289 [Leptolyngbyaceae cyanobacterium JSC-12]